MFVIFENDLIFNGFAVIISPTSPSFARKELLDLFDNHDVFDFLSIKSPSFKKLQIDLEKLSIEDVIDLMVDEPRLIRRPLVKIGNQIFIGDIKLNFMDELDLA